MEKSDPQIIEEQAGHIPAEVQVPAHHIRDVGNRVERAAHGIAGQRGKPVRIHLVAQVVQHMVVIQHVLFVFR